MSTENNIDRSSSSDSDMDQDTPQLKSGFRGEGEDILPNLPPVVKKRVKALKKLLVAQTDIDTKFYTELHILECKYHKEYVEFYNKRSDIVQGNYEPNEEECDFPSDEEDDVKDLSTDLEGKIKLEDSKPAATLPITDVKIKGIPDFWLTILKNTSLISDMIQPHDEPILSHLTDVKVYLLEDPMGFVLEFHFSPNEWFTNTVLTKEYEMKCVPDKNSPLSFEGPEIFKCKGCTIQWNKGKNVTVKLVKKKQKHKVKGAVRFVNKTVQNVSFFHFFSPPTVPDDPETEVDEEIDNLLTTDFEIGHYIRERIIPRAVLYFTGEALLDENDFDEDDEEEESENDDEDEDEDEDEGTNNDPEYNPRQDKLINKQVNPAECKQQ
jgi:nucleosome assembly protein 1-like 1